jgi:hypothetical protein
MYSDTRLLSNVKSVNILGSVDNGRVLPNLHGTLTWLHEYNNHWIDMTGVMDGRNAHLLYDRSVVFEAEGISTCIDDLKEFSLGVRSLGMQFIWRVRLQELVALPIRPSVLIDEAEIGTVAVILGNEINALEYNGLTDLLAIGCSIQLIGKLELLMECGLCSEVCFNSRHVEIVNVDSADANQIDVMARTRSCDGRLSVSISSTGHIFPCPYLVSSPPEFAIGHLSQSFSHLMNEDREIVEVLAKLVNRGPSQVPTIYEGKAEKGIPVECQLHLKRLKETMTDGKLSSIY